MTKTALSVAVVAAHGHLHAPKTGAAASPLFCRFKWGLKSPVFKNTPENPDSPSAWT